MVDDSLLRFQSVMRDFIWAVDAVKEFVADNENAVYFSGGDEPAVLPSVRCTYVSHSTLNFDAPFINRTEIQVDCFSADKNATMVCGDAIARATALALFELPILIDSIQISDVRYPVFQRLGAVAGPGTSGVYATTLMIPATWRVLPYIAPVT